jgi:glucose/arabinose dehydrogenase
MKRRIVVAAAIAALLLVVGGGSAAVLCKLEFQCGIGQHFVKSESGYEHDKKMLREVTADARNAPRGVVPQGFRETILANGFKLPTDFAFVSGTEVLISEKTGRVLEWSAETRSSRVVLDLAPRIDPTLFRGVITVAADPDYAKNHYIYVLYVLKPKSTKEEATTVARLSRFVLPPGGRARDEHVLVGSVTAPTCSTLPATADCLSSDLDHDGAQIAFAHDNSMFVATGDGGGHDERVEPSAIQSQNPDALDGKVIHIDRDGQGLPGNPYWNGNPNANRSKVWAIGLRNPFRLTLDPRTGVPIVGDVGVGREEEVDAAKRGTNLGWPCWEGNLEALTYHHTAFCKRFYAHPPANLRRPLVVVHHVGGAGSIAGGTFAPKSFGPAYADTYFFGDWIHGWIRGVKIDGNDEHAGPMRPFASHEPGPVAIKIGPDDALYVLALNSGDLRRIARTG